MCSLLRCSILSSVFGFRAASAASPVWHSLGSDWFCSLQVQIETPSRNNQRPQSWSLPSVCYRRKLRAASKSKVQFRIFSFQALGALLRYRSWKGLSVPREDSVWVVKIGFPSSLSISDIFLSENEVISTV